MPASLAPQRDDREETQSNGNQRHRRRFGDPERPGSIVPIDGDLLWSDGLVEFNAGGDGFSLIRILIEEGLVGRHLVKPVGVEMKILLNNGGGPITTHVANRGSHDFGPEAREHGGQQKR